MWRNLPLRNKGMQHAKDPWPRKMQALLSFQHPGRVPLGICHFIGMDDMGVSKNTGTPKWMVYNGNPY